MTVRGSSSFADTHSADSLVTWKWVGDLDAGDAADLRDTWRSLVHERRGRIVIDLAAVTFIDCSVVDFLVLARRELGSRLVLHSVPRPVLRLFALTQQTDLLLPPGNEAGGGLGED